MDNKIAHPSKPQHTVASPAKKPKKRPNSGSSQAKDSLKHTLAQTPTLSTTPRTQAKTLQGLIQLLQAQDLSRPHYSLASVLSLDLQALLKNPACQKPIADYLQSIVNILSENFWEPSPQVPEPLETVSLLEHLEQKAGSLESLETIQPLYKTIYQYYSNAYFNHKHAGNLAFLSGTDRDPSRLKVALEDQFEVFVSNIYHPKHIISDIAFYKPDFKVASLQVPTTTICIRNTEGYFDIPHEAFSKDLPSAPISGSPLFLKQGTTQTPIGYNIYLPKDPKAILVRVYGGYGTHDICKQAAYEANFIKGFEKALLHQGIAVANLNLPDLLELNDHQSLMSKELYLKIQSCIHTFYSTLTDHPEQLDANLLALKSLPIFLGGHSFGAALSLNHSKLYPDTFKGYVSSCGVLDPTSHRGSLSPEQVDSQFPTLETASTVKEPVLVLQNFNDKNVRLKNALSWAKKAHQHNKAFSLCILHNGATDGPPTHEASRYSGHAIPTTESSFQTYTEHLAAFLLDPKGQTSGITRDINRWRRHEYGSYFQTYDHYKDPDSQQWKGSLDKHFLSEAYRVYKDSRPPLNLQGHPAPERPLASLITDPKHQERSWAECYFPLYKATYLANQFNLRDLLRELESFDAISTKVTKVSEALLQTLLPAMSQYFTVNITPTKEEKEALLKYLKDTLLSCINNPTNLNNELLPLVQVFVKTLFYLYPEDAENIVMPSKLAEANAQSDRLKKQFLKQIHKSRSLGASVITKSLSHLHSNKRLEKLVQDYRSSKKA